MTGRTFDLDTAIFEYLLIKHETGNAGLWISATQMIQDLQEQFTVTINLADVQNAVATTRYTQRDFLGRVTKTSPYQETWQDDALHQLLMPDFVAKKTHEWGW